jgi:hypothetical protein
MASVSESVRPVPPAAPSAAPEAAPAPKSKVRHGTCSLTLRLNSGQRYRLHRLPSNRYERGSIVWGLDKLTDDGPRYYLVTQFKGVITCTCPDSQINLSECKHMRALVACGLVKGQFAPGAGVPFTEPAYPMAYPGEPFDA